VTEKHSLTPDQMYPVLRYFEFDHLPEPLKSISEQFYFLAHKFADLLPYCAETSTCLRKLLEAKDCAVRAALED
jgi:hypothetical protein